MPAKIIDVDRANFRARLFRWRPLRGRYRLEREYRIAVGRAAYATPLGPAEVERKDWDPTWRPPPDADWVTAEMRDERGVPVPIPGGDPRNPLRGAFLAISGGEAIGLHGTADLDSLGTAASHGCIRLSEADARDLYRRAPLGTIVFVYDGSSPPAA